MNIYRSMYNPKPNEEIKKQKAYIVGGGIAGLAAAVFLIDDAKMPGENITIYEKRKSFGGCCDAFLNNDGYYICPGERELEPYMECLWYLCSKIPSLDDPTRTILDESYESNQETPIHSECRILVNNGHIDDSIHDFTLKNETKKKLIKFLYEDEKNLENLSIEEYFGKDSEFFLGSMWWCFHPMLAFKPYHSALEAKRYLTRFGLGTRIDYLEGILHTKRNENDSIIKPIVKWLKEHHVNFSYESDVYDLDFTDKECNTVNKIIFKNKEDVIIKNNDLVFVTNGSLMTNSTFGDNKHAAITNTNNDDVGLFNIWRNIAKKNEKFGHPEKFLNQIDKTKWISFFVTIKDYPQFFDKIEELTGSKRGTGGCITLKDSAWEMSGMFYDRNYFIDQDERNEDVAWFDGLFGERVGNYIKKKMADCTGEEILLEWLYHLNLLDMKDEVLAHSKVSICMMPYITSQFMPRTNEDRPRIVPKGCTNLAFLGQFVEVDEDVVFTIETSVRTPLEAVYKLTHLNKEPLEVNPSRYDIRYNKEKIMKQLGLKQGQILTKDDLPKMNPIKMMFAKKKIVDTILKKINGIPPYYVMYPGKDKTVAQKESVLNPKYPKINNRK